MCNFINHVHKASYGAIRQVFFLEILGLYLDPPHKNKHILQANNSDIGYKEVAGISNHLNMT